MKTRIAIAATTALLLASLASGVPAQAAGGKLRVGRLHHLNIGHALHNAFHVGKKNRPTTK